MSNIELLQSKLTELSDKLATKDKLGVQYATRVQNSLTTIRSKLNNIIAVYKKNVQDIQSSKSELDNTKAKLTAQQELSQNALQDANNKNNDLQASLNNTNQQLDALKTQLNQSNLDKEAMQQSIDAARTEVEQAKNALAGSNAQIEGLNSKLKTYDELVQSLVSIIEKIDNMSINQKELGELDTLLTDTENMFPKDDSGSAGNAGGFFGNIFGTSTSTPAATSTSAATSTPTTRTPRGPNTAYGQTDPENLIPLSRGGRTKRRKTMHRGGYINRLRTKKHRKHTRTNKRRSSRSSKSSSKSSKHSA
jgi:chromosome segregation ATPase